MRAGISTLGWGLHSRCKGAGLALRCWERLPRARIWRMTELSKARCGVGKERATVRCAEEIDGE